MCGHLSVFVHYQKNAQLMILSNAVSEILNLPLIDYKCYLKFVESYWKYCVKCPKMLFID